MKLDVTCMRYLSKDDFRVLVAVEMGMRNHELVPIELITSIAKLRHGGSHKILSTLLRYKLVAHASNDYNGYRLSYMGFDILALRALLGRGIISSVGRQIGVGECCSRSYSGCGGGDGVGGVSIMLLVGLLLMIKLYDNDIDNIVCSCCYCSTFTVT